jgi:hypothetical protein
LEKSAIRRFRSIARTNQRETNRPRITTIGWPIASAPVDLVAEHLGSTALSADSRFVQRWKSLFVDAQSHPGIQGYIDRNRHRLNPIVRRMTFTLPWQIRP